MTDDIEIVAESYESFALRRVRAHFRDNPQVRDVFVENGVMTKTATLVDLVTDPRLSDEGRAKAAAIVHKAVDEMCLGTT